MENLNWKELQIWTSYVTPDLLTSIAERGILPIFIARNITNSGLIGGWQGTAVHFPELAPGPELLRDWKYRGMSTEEFDRLFEAELTKNVYLPKVLDRLEVLRSVSGAIGIALMGYGQDPAKDHRHVVARFINSSGLLKNTVIELIP